MQSVKKVFVLVLVAAGLSLGAVGCQSDSNGAASPGAASERPRADHPADHPRDHPAGDHPK